MLSPTIPPQLHHFLTPLLENSYDNAAQVDSEVETVCHHIVQLADTILPHFKSKGKANHKTFHDKELKQLWKVSRSSWNIWKDAGRPKEGDLFDRKRATKKAVQQRINVLRSQQERTKAQSTDKKFRLKYRNRFKINNQSTSAPNCKLKVNDQLLTGKERVLSSWADYFKTLATSKLDCSQSTTQILSLLERSFYDEDVILDTPIEIEELEATVKHLRRGSSSGPDGILPEHIIYAGTGLMIWRKKIYNAIIFLEQIPDCFKSAFIIPIFNGKGKDPLSPSNYRGISLSYVVGKLFERVVLARILPFLQEIQIPHYTQSAYQQVSHVATQQK